MKLVFKIATIMMALLGSLLLLSITIQQGIAAPNFALIPTFANIKCSSCDPIDYFALPNGKFLQIDNHGEPHVVYKSDDQFGGLHYAFLNGVVWSQEVVDPINLVGSNTSLALDQNGLPHIIYEDGSNSLKLKYAYKDDTGWHLEKVFENHIGYMGTIALDQLGNPSVAYYGTDDLSSSYPMQYKLKYGFRDVQGWHITTIEDVGIYINTIANSPSLVLDDSDYPHISFRNTIGQLKYTTFNGNEWSSEIIYNETSEEPLGSDVSMKLDNSNMPHIIFQTQYVGNPPAPGGLPKHAVLYHAYRIESGVWTKEVIDEDYMIEYPVISIDLSNHVHVVYGSYTNDGYWIGTHRLNYGIQNVEDWSITVLDSNNDRSIYGKMYSDIGFANSDQVRIAYVEYGQLNYLVQLNHSIYFPLIFQ